MPYVRSDTSVSALSGGTIIDRARRKFLSGRREELNQLAQTVGERASSLRFTRDLASIQAGSVVEIDTELYRVWSVDNTSKSAEVLPAFEGTTTSIHSEGALVRVNPRIPTSVAFDDLNAELRALSGAGLFTMSYVDLTYLSNTWSYDLPGVVNFLDDYNVRANEKIVTGSTFWRDIPNWKFDANADVTQFPSTYALYLPPGFPGGWPGQEMQFLYKAGFGTLTAPSNDLFDVAGVPVEMHDILEYGLIMRMGPVREIKRNFTESQGDTRRPSEVGPSAVMNSFSWIERKYKERIREERRRLASSYPEIKPQ